MISRSFALLVARLVLLVNDYRAEVGKRSKHRGARTNCDTPFAAPQRQPRVVPFSVAESRMQDSDAVAKDSPEPVHCLRRQRNLGYENNARLPLLEHETFQYFDVNQRLSAAGHAVQQKYFSGLCIGDRSNCLGLRGRGPVLQNRRDWARGEGITLHLLRLYHH
jgi:hypothetical protein